MTYWIVNPFDDLPNEGGGTQRFLNLSRELVSRGHKVIWWTMDFSHRRKARRHPCPTTDGVDIKLIPVPAYKRNISVGRMINHGLLGIRFYGEALKIIPTILDQNIVIVVSMPPLETCYAALRLKASFPNVRVVVDIMDAWPDVLVEVVCSRAKILRPLARMILMPYYAILRKITSEADGITAVNEEYIKLVKRYGFSGSAKVVYSGGEVTEINELYEKWQKMQLEHNAKLRIAYVGAMGRVYDLPSAYTAIKLLQSEGIEVELEVAGGSPGDLIKQKEFCVEAGVSSHVVFHGFLGGRDLAKMLSRCHIGLIPMFRESLVALPYKARDYAGAGLPMINSLGWDIKQLIEKYGAGWQYEAGDPASFAAAMREAANNRQILIKKSIGSRRLAHDCFEVKTVYNEWCQWLEWTAGRSPGNMLLRE